MRFFVMIMLFFCLVNMGISPNHRLGHQITYYTNYLEVPLLTETKNYYSAESQIFLQDNSVSKYVVQVRYLLVSLNLMISFG